MTMKKTTSSNPYSTVICTPDTEQHIDIQEKFMKDALTDFAKYQRKLESTGLCSIIEWNANFQHVFDETDSIKKDAMLCEISLNFSMLSQLYGQIILQEKVFKVKAITSEKTFAGTAGGDKIVIRNLVFKISNDLEVLPEYYLYGKTSPNYEVASKSSGHELQGAVYLLAAIAMDDKKSQNNMGSATTAIMCVIDYIGYRLIAMPVLPLKKIVYGSSDSMLTVHNNATVHSVMKNIAEQLHLKLHSIGDTGKQLYTAGDVEGHIGSDGKIYFLDTARMFPPEAPMNRRDLYTWGNVTLYRILRPEFMQRRRAKDMPALNPDVWSGWSDGNIDDQQNNTDATNDLLNDTVQKIVKGLLYTKRVSGSMMFGTMSLHYFGLNMRHLGLVYLKLLQSKSKNIICDNPVLGQIISRTLKNTLRCILRAASASGELLFSVQMIVSRWINSCINDFCRDNITKAIFQDAYAYNARMVLSGMLLRYGTAFLKSSDIENWDIRKKNLFKDKTFFNSIIIFTLQSIGTAMQDYLINDYTSAVKWTEEDVKQIVRAKNFDIVEIAMARYSFRRAVEIVPNSNINKRLLARLYVRSAVHYMRAHEICLLRLENIEHSFNSHMSAFEVMGEYVSSSKVAMLATFNDEITIKWFEENNLSPTDVISKRLSMFESKLKCRETWVCSFEELNYLKCAFGQQDYQEIYKKIKIIKPDVNIEKIGIKSIEELSEEEIQQEVNKVEHKKFRKNVVDYQYIEEMLLEPLKRYFLRTNDNDSGVQ